MSDDPESAKVGELDLSTRRDRTLLLNSAKKGWELSDEIYALAPAVLEEQIRLLRETGGKSRDITRCIQTILALDEANRKKAERAEDIERLDAGKATENVTYDVRMPGPTRIEGD